MREAAGGAVELNCDGDACRQARGQAKEQTETESVSEAKDDRIGNGAGQQAKRAMLSAKQVIGEIEAAQHVKACAGDADGGDDVVIDGQREKANMDIARIAVIARNRCDRKLPESLELPKSDN